MARLQIEQLRAAMKQENIDAYIILTDDFHGSEYVGEYFKCREYVSGFDGSAGTLVVTKDKAGLWTDGRYFLQADRQLRGSGIELMRIGEEETPKIEEFLHDNLGNKQTIGYDGRTITAEYADFLKESLKDTGVLWKEDVDLVCRIWSGRPAMQAQPVWILPDKYTGEERRHKLMRLREKLQEKNADVMLISALDEVCWLYNIRGNDVEYNPVVLSYTIITKTEAILYINQKAVSKEISMLLYRDGIAIKPYFQIYEDIKQLHGLNIMCDRGAVNFALLAEASKDNNIIDTISPIKLFKAVKNPVEMENEVYAHILDGAAVTRLIYWLKNRFGKERITELEVCRKLEELRCGIKSYLGQSFAAIAGSGAHGAIIHYEPTVDSDIELVDNSFLLLDTGGHYMEGTTDVTRTIACGALSQEQKRNYTAVLCGNLNIGDVYFKYGCTGANFDYMARSALWRRGLDYRHGTGHGVGYILNVHEGPNAIRLKNSDNSVGTVFEEGMITSNEPGVYLENQYGIRLENLIMCIKDKKTEYGQFMKMQTLTLVPFDRNAIDVSMLDSRQIALLNEYHRQVFEKIGHMLNDDERAWLREETKAL
ncbi:MAG: aminopeptidase P family protein [Eubacteriales bacterium]|nr:aminopeptidase P family protein [Eubacteriales bacterium]